MIKRHLSVSSLAITLVAMATVNATAFDYPPTAQQPVTNTYFGTAVVDNYQWLENFEDPAVKAWNAAQNRVSRAYLDQLPDRPVIAARLKELYAATSANYSGLMPRPGVLFAMKFQPPAQQPWVVALNSLDDLASERTVLDPNRLSTNGTVAMDFVVPSHDGKKLAVSLSQNGSEDGTVYIYDVATGQRLADRIPRVQYPTGGGSVAWNSDDSGIYYTRYPHAGERPAEDLNFYQQVYFHRLGTPLEQDTYQLGRGLPRIAEIELGASEDGRWLIAAVANGDGGEYAHFLLGPDGAWKQVTGFKDQIRMAGFGRDHELYLLSRAGAPRGKILRVPLDQPELARATLVVPESDAVISGICPADSGLYVQDLIGGPSQIRFFGRTNSTPQIIPLKPVSAVQQMLCPKGDQLLFRTITYIDPYAWSTYDPATQTVHPTKVAGTSPADFSDLEVVREFATSKDGTQVPLNIIHRKDIKLDGNNPTLLYAYGGYSISQQPGFNPTRRLWFDRGGVYVVANLRGGGEYGEAWHQAGNLTRKQHVFDDFIAGAEWLIKHGYTNPKKLAIEGGSNGGLLMGAVLTQRPDLFRAVVSHVGIYDSLRSELEPNGAFNITEFGTVKDPDQFQALDAYSPYHHVVDGTHYPAILLMTGDHDGRVNPYHSRKMMARLQAANRSEYPILLRTTAAAGHGIGTGLGERIAQEADGDAFLFDQLAAANKP